MKAISPRRHYHTLLFVFTFLIVLLGAVFAGAGVFALLPSNLGQGYGAVISTIQEMRQALLLKVGGIYAFMSVFLILAVVILHLFYSHRIAGPAYRLGREAAALGQGNLKGNIRFRRKDNLTEMADSLNHAASQYRDRISAVNNYLSLVEAQTESFADLIRQGENITALEQELIEITLNLKKVNQVLSEIRT